MEYSYIQKMAICRILLEIIAIDGVIDERETFYFEKVKKELGLTGEDHFKVQNHGILRSLSVIKAMTEEQKMDYANFMKTMIMADDIIDENERVAFEDICQFCNISLIPLE